MRAQRAPRGVGAEQGHEHRVGGHLPIHVQERGLLGRIAVVVAGAAAHEHQRLVLLEDAQQQLLLLVAEAVVNHEAHVLAWIQVALAHAQLLARALDGGAPGGDRVVGEAGAQADAHVEVAPERAEHHAAVVDAGVVQLAAGGGAHQAAALGQPLAHRAVEGHLIPLPRGVHHHQLGHDAPKLFEQVLRGCDWLLQGGSSRLHLHLRHGGPPKEWSRRLEAALRVCSVAGTGTLLEGLAATAHIHARNGPKLLLVALGIARVAGKARRLAGAPHALRRQVAFAALRHGRANPLRAAVDEVHADEDGPLELEAQGRMARRARGAVVVAVQHRVQLPALAVAGVARARGQHRLGFQLGAHLDFDRLAVGNVLPQVYTAPLDGDQVGAGLGVGGKLEAPGVAHRGGPAHVHRIERAAEQLVGGREGPELRVDAVPGGRADGLHVGLGGEERLHIDDGADGLDALRRSHDLRDQHAFAVLPPVIRRGRVEEGTVVLNARLVLAKDDIIVGRKPTHWVEPFARTILQGEPEADVRARRVGAILEGWRHGRHVHGEAVVVRRLGHLLHGDGVRGKGAQRPAQAQGLGAGIERQGLLPGLRAGVAQLQQRLLQVVGRPGAVLERRAVIRPLNGAEAAHEEVVAVLALVVLARV
ncbi:hypothetical protein STIAU_5671 [Stigmatella aurantiaca DW4/3-1]|uniref:Uncharacterized protein n=1 Tax=Stigmatella aurantiaca (strain DW4/3-1) TaxID=378806 RepID=Q08VX5_STIAD|nr:hypothetical protein STIAU_5671 [Stigmatella aurantiaca DW4/3-1]